MVERTGRVTNSVWDAPAHVRYTFEVILRQAERDAKRRGDACWLWPRKRNKKGYGEFSWRGRDGKMHGNSAPRVSLELSLGRPLGEGMFPCHCCSIHGASREEKACFNPKHLYEGTMRDNILDNYHGVSRHESK